MERKTYILADVPGFGRVFDCGDCGNMHLTVGPVTITLDPQAYMQLVAMVNTSAANFETWMHQRRCNCEREKYGSQSPIAPHEGNIHADSEDRTDPA